MKGRWETQLRKGVVELAVLAAIARRETYGYRIVEDLRALPGLEFTESTVYPVLTRLAGEGLVLVRAESSATGPTRRYYRLTAAGTRRFEDMRAEWTRVTGSLQGLLEGGPR